MARDRAARTRRQFVQSGLALAGIGLLAGCGITPPWPRSAPVPRIGFLSGSSPSTNVARVEAFRQGLRELGYVEGDGFVMEYRYGDGKPDRVAAFAAELVRLPVDLILAAAPAGTRAAKDATGAIPIVMAYDPDPVGNRFVASLARPGGNITGLSSLAPGISGKQLEFLKAIIPSLSRAVVLGTTAPTPLPLDPRSRELELTAGRLGVDVRFLEVRAVDEIDTAFEAARDVGAEAAIVFASPILEADRMRVVGLAARYQLPAIYAVPEFVTAGGLLCHGVSFIHLYERAAVYVDKILKGAKPGDLPIEQPTKFDFIINLKTAQAIGLAIPQSVLQQATEIIK